MTCCMTCSYLYYVQQALGQFDQSWYALDPTHNSNWVLLASPRTMSGAACTRSKLHHVMAPTSIFKAGKCRRSTFHKVVQQDEARAPVASCGVLFPCLIAQVCAGDHSTRSAGLRGSRHAYVNLNRRHSTIPPGLKTLRMAPRYVYLYSLFKHAYQ